MNSGVAWYVDRLRTMSAPEVAHRVFEQVQIRVLERAQRRFARAQPKQFAFLTATAPQLPPIAWDRQALHRDADALLAGRVDALGAPWQWADVVDVWHRAPDTGALWPSPYFTRVPYRLGNPYGDIRRLWEPARLQHLVGLAALASEPQYRAGAVAMIGRQITSFIAANPPFRGPHYVSAMECALRLIAVCHAVDAARNDLGRENTVMHAVARLATSHAELIWRRPSLHSSAGNHTLVEAVGMLYAGHLFPELRIAARCARRGEDLLRRECARQIHDDGGGAEQSTAYLRFDVELIRLAIALLRSRGRDVDELERRIDRADEFLRALGPFGECGDGIGDADDGVALSRYAVHTARTCVTPRAITTFADSGYTVLRGPRATRVVLDHGGLGLGPLHAHGHADCLSLLVARERRALLIDPGTFTYTGEPRWRAYFRGTPAHNTVTVDLRDQSLQNSAFAWDRPFAARINSRAYGNGATLLATHDGYLRHGVAHWRGIIYDGADRIVVWDWLRGNGERRIDAWWHLGVAATLIGRMARANAGEPFIALRISAGNQVRLFYGHDAPIAGWRARRYGVREPSTSLCATYTGPLPHQIVTSISLSPRAIDLVVTADEQMQIAAFKRAVEER